MAYTVISRCNTNLKTGNIGKQNMFFPVSTDYKETTSTCNKSEHFKTHNHYEKRNIVANLTKHLNHFKRKHNFTMQTTCTPFFIRRTTVKKQVPFVKYPISSTNSESELTDAGSSVESLETRRGKLRNFFFPVLSTASGQQLKLDLNSSVLKVSEYVLVDGWKYEDYKPKLSMDTFSNKNGTRDSFHQTTKQIVAVHETKNYNVSTTKLTVEAPFPSMKFDLGLCAGEPKGILKKTTKESSESKPNGQSPNPVSTFSFFQKLKLKTSTFNRFQQVTQTSYLNSTLNNGTKFEEECSSCFTQKLSQSYKESTSESDIGTTESTSFYPYTKLQVKDLFHFKNRPISELLNMKPTGFVIRGKPLESLTSSYVSLKEASNKGTFDYSGEDRSKRTSQKSKRLKTNTEPENAEVYPSVNPNNTPCDSSECSFDHDVVNDESSDASVETSSSALGVTEALRAEEETNTSTWFVNLKNLFDRKKQNINRNNSWEKLSYTDKSYQPIQDINLHQTLSNVNYTGTTSAYTSDILFSKVPKQRYGVDKTTSITALNTGFKQISFINASLPVNSGKKSPSGKLLAFIDRKPNILTTSSIRDSFHLKSVFYPKNQNKLALLPNLNCNSSEVGETCKKYLLSTTVSVFESQVRPSPNANESLVDMNPEEFYQNLEKSTNSTLGSSSIKKQKLNLKHVFNYIKQPQRSNTTDLSLAPNNQTDYRDGFQNYPIKSDSFKKSTEKAEEEYGQYTSTQRSTKMKFKVNFKTSLTTSKAYQGTSLESSDEPLQRTSSQLSVGRTFPVVFLSTEEETTAGKEIELEQLSPNCSEVSSLRLEVARKVFKLKNVISLHKPVPFNDTKLRHVFDPGGLPSSNQVTLQRQTTSLNNFEKSANLSSMKYNTVIQKTHLTETANTEDSTKPVNWWLFWNQAKVTFNKSSNSNNHPTELFRTKASNFYRWYSTKPPILESTTRNPTIIVPDSSCIFQKSTIPLLQNTQGKGTEFDAKNFSYFIQNLTHKSNMTILGKPKKVIFNSKNNTKENLKFDLLNRTESSTYNMTSGNDSSFSIMAYVLRPLESLISVFKGNSTQNMNKVGDVNASDIHNGSIPSHLHPQNSSLVILALNKTNSTPKEIHESKVGLFDVLGGWFHCIVETYVEPNPRDIHFYLFTRNNIDTPEELFLTEDVELAHEENVTDVPPPVWESQSSSESERKKRHTDEEDASFEPLNVATSELESKWFNLLAETKILIHGYIQDYQTDIIVNMKDAYLKKGAFNVIVVDWSIVGDNTCYPSVAEHGLNSVGRLLSRLLDQLVAGGVSLARIHVVGFSLGAHIAGIAGTNTRGLLSRITGLDPALPYVPMDPDICLDAGDAVFVDIIHSAAGYLGQPGPTGHVDFYPNGGSQQPGCDLASLGACSHRRAALYFIESINSNVGFRALPCDNWHDFQSGRCNNSTSGVDLLMGELCPSNASGKYFLRTGHKEPFALLVEEHSKVKKSLLLDIFYELV